MTTTELAKNIGKTVEYHMPERAQFTISVKIIDARMSYGRLQYKIEPTEGYGSTWVTDERLTI